MSVARVSPNREYHVPKAIPRCGCPSYVVPTCQISTPREGERREVTHKFALMVLTHYTKEGKIKNSLPLGPIHQELELESLALYSSGSSNILLSKMSFDCLITGASGETFRDYLCFDLKIPGVNGAKESVFSYDSIEATYGGKKNLYDTLKHFYDLGHQIAAPNGRGHGHHPDYDSTNSKHDQYIRHTEQLLVAYFALPEAAEMLCNRLRTEIRGKYPDASSVKVYNMGLHMQSTKTCCAPCEYSLVGLMNELNGFMLNGKPLGFLSNFKRICAVPNPQLLFTLPKKSPFRLLVTVSASGADADHQKQPTYSRSRLAVRDLAIDYKISVKHEFVSRTIFTAMLDSGYDARRLLPSSASTLIDKTIGISGSKATSGSYGTIEKTRKARDEEKKAVAVVMDKVAQMLPV